MLILASALALLSAATPDASSEAADIETTRPAAPCLATSRALAAGEQIAAPDVVAAPCPTTAPRAVRYDRLTRTAVAARPLPAGSALGPLTLAPTSAIGRGTVLTLRSVAGPVTVERPVTTLQSGHAGGRVFVRDDAGAVFSVPLELEDAP